MASIFNLSKTAIEYAIELKAVKQLLNQGINTRVDHIV